MLEVIIFLLLILVIYLIYKNIEWKFKFEEKVRKYIEEKEEEIRRDAIERSSRILSGKALEKMVPFLKEFNHSPHDVRWLGDPVDLIAFDGISEGNPQKITFIEIKSWKSRLSEKQKKIRQIVEEKKVFWEEIKIEEK
jgi:predicted Holliday junction resolvase-like endonuclease